MQRVGFIKEVETANEYWTWKKTCYVEGEDDRVHLAKKERWKGRSVGIIRVFMKSENLIDCVERVYMVDNIERTYWESFWKNAYMKYKDL